MSAVHTGHRPRPEATQDAAAAAGPARPRGCTALHLRELTRAVSQLYDAELARAGLKTTQYSLLSCVARLGPARPGEIARTMHMDASTLTRNLAPLLKSGLLVQGPGPDGRSRQVDITAHGRAVREQARRHWRAAQDRLEKVLGVDTVLALHALVRSSLDALDSHAAGETDHE